MNKATQKGTGRNNNRSACKPAAILKNNPGNYIALEIDIESVSFDNIEIRNGRNFSLHGFTIETPVSLGARPTNRRPLSPIEQTELYTGTIGHASHQPIERINLTDKVTLAKTTNGRITGHHAYRCRLMRNQCRSRTDPGSRSRSLDAGMPAANHNHIIIHDIRHTYLPVSRETFKATRTRCTVSRESFPYAKLGEDNVQKMLDINPPRYPT